ncbi:RING finger protein 37 isoform X2 [Aptenodytes patagonicus]|uniref:RING finger protein 37 isoform X2 n=1 Tax=Aptenodytes patagonicus TaxID=9234 RepID=UPI003FA01138
MVINVCLPQFKPRIHCNKISADGYEVENLISEDLAKRNRGFRSEYFIKPPVHITISFPFNIEICRINIDISSGGYQTFSGLEVYTSTSCNKTSWQSPEGQFSGLAGQPVSDKDTFTLVGKAVLKNQSKVTFGHRGFKPRPPFHQMENVFSYPGSASQDLWNKGPSSLSNVSHLKICITHVAGGSLPCIKRLEVWGQPAKSCPQEVIEGVFQVASQFFAQDVGSLKPELWTPMESDCVPFSANDSEQQTLRKLVDVVQDIPEEFLDPITLEIMTFPMLLPSGKVIDQTTLEKCNRSEASWGRVPSDPFTGVAFSQHSQPLPHPTLKARIDHFLLQHSIPGTNLLGRAHASEMLVPSSVTMSSLKRKMDCMDQSSVQPPYFSSTNLLVTSTSENSAKKMKTDSDSHLIQMDCSTGIPETCWSCCQCNCYVDVTVLRTATLISSIMKLSYCFRSGLSRTKTVGEFGHCLELGAQLNALVYGQADEKPAAGAERGRLQQLVERGHRPRARQEQPDPRMRFLRQNLLLLFQNGARLPASLRPPHVSPVLGREAEVSVIDTVREL